MTFLRSWWLWGVVAVVALCAYLVSPLIAAAKLAKYVRVRDVPAVMERVEVAPLRRSLTRQLVKSYIVLNRKEGELGVLGQQFAVSMAVTLLDPILEQMTTPDAIADLLRKGWPASAGVETGAAGNFSIAGLRDLLDHLDGAMFTGLSEFRLIIDIDGSPERRLGWRMRLDGLTWKLHAIDLSPELLKLIVDRMPKADRMKIEGASGQKMTF